MKFVNLGKGKQTQLYIFPTIIVSKNPVKTRVFICWIFWSIEL